MSGAECYALNRKERGADDMSEFYFISVLLGTVVEKAKGYPAISISILFLFFLIHWLRGRRLLKIHLEKEIGENRRALQQKERRKQLYEEYIKHIVYQTSPRLRTLKEINESASREQFRNGLEVNFPATPERLTTVVNNKYYFEHFDFKQGIIHAMKRALKEEETLKYTKKSFEIEKEYIEALEYLPPFVTKEVKEKLEGTEYLSFEEYAKMERDLYGQCSKAGICDWEVELAVKLPAKNGKPSRWQYKTYKKEELIKIWEAVQKGIQSNEYQRMLVTPKIRYQIMKRDRFTCQICGRKSPEVKLHVDHIKPVSKGGTLGGEKYNNLRTLCDLCNVGKSDAYDPVGIN